MEFSKFIDVNTEKFKLDTINQANALFWRWNQVEGTLFLSEQTKVILGYKDEDLGGVFNSWEHVWHKNEKDRMLKIVKSSMISKKNEFTMLQRFIHKDQSTHWYFNKGVIIKDKASLAIEVHGFCINADDLIKIYRYLNLNEHEYLDYISATHTATWYWNVQTGETTFNDRWAQMIGYTLEELEPISFDTWKKHVHPDDLENAIKKLKLTLESKNSYYENKFRMVHKKGYDVWIHDRGKIIEWTSENKPLIMMGTHNDISQSKKLENQIIEDEKRYKNLVESSHDIIYTIDLEKKLTFISKAVERLLGYQTKDILNKTLNNFIHPEDYKRADDFLRM
jgi:diguanylate cyclase